MRDSSPALPGDIESLVDALARERGVVAVALGGSRAMGCADANSDWDLAVYYRGDVGTEALARYGEVYPPGSWGRIMKAALGSRSAVRRWMCCSATWTLPSTGRSTLVQDGTRSMRSWPTWLVCRRTASSPNWLSA
jgi:hypothetical protein